MTFSLGTTFFVSFVSILATYHVSLDLLLSGIRLNQTLTDCTQSQFKYRAVGYIICFTNKPELCNISFQALLLFWNKVFESTRYLSLRPFLNESYQIILSIKWLKGSKSFMHPMYKFSWWQTVCLNLPFSGAHGCACALAVSVLSHVCACVCELWTIWEVWIMLVFSFHMNIFWQTFRKERENDLFLLLLPSWLYQPFSSDHYPSPDITCIITWLA